MNTKWAIATIVALAVGLHQTGGAGASVQPAEPTLPESAELVCTFDTFGQDRLWRAGFDGDEGWMLASENKQLTRTLRDVRGLWPVSVHREKTLISLIETAADATAILTVYFPETGQMGGVSIHSAVYLQARPIMTIVGHTAPVPISSNGTCMRL